MSALWSTFPQNTHCRLWVQYGMKNYYEYLQVLMGFWKFIQAFLCGQHSLHSVWLSFTSCITSLTTPYLVNLEVWGGDWDIDFIIRIAWHCRWLVRMLRNIRSNMAENVPESPLSRTTKKPSHSCILKSKGVHSVPFPLLFLHELESKQKGPWLRLTHAHICSDHHPLLFLLPNRFIWFC